MYNWLSILQFTTVYISDQYWTHMLVIMAWLDALYEGHPINKLQNGIILLIFKI